MNTTKAELPTHSLFDPVEAGSLRLPNRIVMAPLTRNRAPRCVPTPLMAQYYAQRASAGLLITEATAVCPQALGYSDVPGLWTDEQSTGWRQVTDAVHARNGRIVVQLWHVGRISHTSLQPDGHPPVAPSAIAAKAKTYLIQNGGGSFQPTSIPRALKSSEIPGILKDFQLAANRAVNLAGFDGVEIHGANGYLFDQFLKTSANRREDEYGGSIDNRVRLTVEVCRTVAREIGGGRTGLRLSPISPANDVCDDDPQALFENLMRGVASLGLSYIHIVEGSTGGPRVIVDRPFDYQGMYRAYRDAGGKGAWMVNNGYDKNLAEKAVNAQADLVAFGRAFISNPDLVERLRVNAPLNALEKSTLYGGDATGYTDYSTLN